MPGTARKVTIGLLLILTLALAGIAGVIALRLQQQGTVAPSNADAAGFGSNATKDLYDTFGDYFAGLDCEEFLPKLALARIPQYKEFDIDSNAADLFDENSIEVFDQAASGDTAINCLYQLDSDHSINVSLTAYNLNSTIDATPSALYTRVNTTNITNTLDSGTTISTVVFFGTGTETKTCVSNVYHAQNDFEHVTVLYEGFSDCTDLIGLNQAVTTVISDYLVAFVTDVNDEKGYVKLCDGWAREQTAWCDPDQCVSNICSDGEWVEDTDTNACAGGLLCAGNPNYEDKL